MLKSILLLLALTSTTYAGEAGRLYAEQKGYSVPQRQWFQDQKVPGQTATCCSTADGEEVQEQIRGENYWIKGGKFPDWTEVPKAVVIEAPNIIGQPVVWYTATTNESGITYGIRCYAPGPKM